MPDGAGQGDTGRHPLRTLADKVNWLAEHAHGADSGPLSNADICFMVHKATGEEISNTTVWKLRNGQQTNPQLRVIQALAKTFGVKPDFFFDDYDEEKLGLLQDQVELLALVRDAGITSAQFRVLLGLDDEGRKAVAGLIRRNARTGASAPGGGQDQTVGNG